MSAKKGNKYALGNNGGRHPIVDIDKREELFNTMLNDFQAHLDDFDNNKSPIFIENWCRKHNLSDQTLRNYLDENEEFLATYKKCKQIQKELLILGGLKGYFNPTAFIFTAKNITDMRDKTETDLTSGGEKLGVIILPPKNADKLETTG
jgi:hypothetical protein